jgi:hypothetical protein
MEKDEITFGSADDLSSFGSKSAPEAPAEEPTESSQAEAEASEEETSMGNDSAVDREDQVRADAAAAAEAAQQKINEQLNAGRENARQEYANSDRGLVAHANAEAERIMHLPTPDALEELGAVVGDPTRGPAS